VNFSTVHIIRQHAVFMLVVTRNPSVVVRLLLSQSTVTLAASNTKTTNDHELDQCMTELSDS
jgi:hypothetical protein